MAFGDEIQLEAGASGTGTSITETFTSTPTEGNLLIAWAMTGDGTLNAPTGWSTGVYVDNTTEADVCAVYYKIAGAAESTTVTVTSSASDEWVINIAEYEGPWDSSPVDLSEAEARDATSPSTYVVSPTGTTAVADELATLVIYKRNKSGGFTFSDSFLQKIDMQSANKRLGGAAKLLTATGGVSCTVTITATATTMGGMVTFKKGSTGVKIINEAVNFNEVTARPRVQVRVLGETLNINEAVVTAQTLLRIIDETENTNEAITRAIILIRVTDEGVNLVEGAIETKLITQVLSEVLNIPETTVNIVAAVVVKIVDEAVNFNEAIVETELLTHIIAEVLNLPESVITAENIVGVIAEIAQTSETTAEALARIRMLNEIVNINEDVQSVTGIVQIINETLDIIESLVRKTAVPLVQIITAVIKLFTRL